MNMNCAACSTSNIDLDKYGNCIYCSIYTKQDIGVDTLTTCGTFNTTDCMSVEDLWKIFEQQEKKDDK